MVLAVDVEVEVRYQCYCAIIIIACVRMCGGIRSNGRRKLQKTDIF
jgi:small basic protein